MSENKLLSRTDMLALGFMTFAFFLGAGNIIFPPAAGMAAGTAFMPTMLGFLVTAVGLPLLTLLACAKVGGGLPAMTKALPVGVATTLIVAIYLVIGPAFAAPRTALVAFEIGAVPFLTDVSAKQQLAYSFVYFGFVAMLSQHRGNLLDYVGKILTPVLVLLLLVLSAAVLLEPQGSVSAAQPDYQDAAFAQGFVDGYNTMDLFGALIFGMLIIDVLKKKGVTQGAALNRYLIIASIIAASGLAFVYISLFVLGATAGSLVELQANGGKIIAVYVQALFGDAGALILAGVVSLACLTTAVGLISACADYFSSRWPILSYRPLVLLFSFLSALVANFGLSELIAISVPVLFALYPVCIALVVMCFIKLPCPSKAMRLVLTVAFVVALFDAMKASGLSWLQPVAELGAFLPLAAQGMGWVVPVGLAIAVSFRLKPGASAGVENA